jgi:RHS repeat-associated protein
VCRAYFYGYQGSEADDEISGEGNSYTTQYRFLDVRIGRWLSLDPLMDNFPSMTPYNSMNNNPIIFNDPYGDAPPKNIHYYNMYKQSNGSYKPGDKVYSSSQLIFKTSNAHYKNSKTGDYTKLYNLGVDNWGIQHHNDVVNVYTYWSHGKITKQVAVAAHTLADNKVDTDQDVLFDKLSNPKKYEYGPGNFEWEARSSGACYPTSIAAPIVDEAHGGVAYVAEGLGASKETADKIATGVTFVGSVMLSRRLSSGRLSSGKSLSTPIKPRSYSPNGQFYSVAYEVRLADNILQKDYGVHFRQANKQLISAMESDATFSKSMSQLGMSFKTGVNGKPNLSTSPNNFVWHHDVTPGTLQLVPSNQHFTGSIYWNTLHPNGLGGMALWGFKTK